MANIVDKVAAIRKAIFGRDVRESIASGIEAINTEVVNTTARQNVIDQQEQTRIDAENIRKSNETTRQTQESTRVSNETTRQSNETTRINTFNTNESARQSTFTINETARQTEFDENEAVRISNDNDRATQFNALKSQITTSITDANTATVNANTATSNYTTVVEQTRKIYKPAVDSFADLSIKYPNPEVGWTATAKDSNIEYRWDGVEWMYIGSSDPSTGYSVVVGSTPPDNINSIWLDSPESNRYAKIIPSVTEPTETGQIWWEMDA